MEKVIKWEDGNGTITVSYNGNGNGTITVISTPNNTEADRCQKITIETTDEKITIKKTLLICQRGITNGGNATTVEFKNTIDCETADSVFVAKEDTWLDGGSANLSD